MLIIIEGIDQSGKTTFAKKLCEVVKDSVYYHLPNYELESGKYIQKVLNGEISHTPKELQMLYKTNRLETLELIKIDLQNHKNVICDRYAYSNYIYSLALKLDIDFCMEMKKDRIKPDLKIFMDCPFDVAQSRRKLKSDNDIYEEDKLQKCVYECYTGFIHRRLHKWLILDHESSIEYNIKKTLIVINDCWC